MAGHTDPWVTVCELCAAQVFNAEHFADLFVGSEYEDETGGIWLIRSLAQASARCNFCSLVAEVLSGARLADDKKATVRVYATSREGRPSSDVSVLFVDAGASGCRRYNIYADKDDPAAQAISTREPNPIVDSPSSFSLARKWISECNDLHELCRRKSSPLPNRVLDVSPGGNFNSLKLCVTGGFEGTYVTLSYCWGAPQPRMLTTSNLDSYTTRIELETLPRSIQDAIRVVREIGLKYLWVDSLCILQDSPGDKAHEIGRMAQIYKNSSLTILAASAATCEGGFLDRSRISGSIDTIRLPYIGSEPHLRSGSMQLRPWTSQSDHDPSLDPANLRAWIFQERLLSPRLLVYPSSPHPMQWRCLCASKTDGGVSPSPEEFGVEQLSPEFYLHASSPGDNADITDKSLCRLWSCVLRNYTSRFLTSGSDKLPAMAGVASEFARLRNESAEQYCAGLWRNEMPFELLWRIFPMDNSQFSNDGRDTQAYRAPSWSWASSDVQVLMPSQVPTHTYYFEIVECEVQPLVSEVGFGEVKSASLVVNAMLKTCTWNKHPRRLLDGDTVIGEGVADEVLAQGKAKIWCMPILDAQKYTRYQATGLLLEQVLGKFRRVGVMMLHKHDWFEGSEIQNFAIV